MRFESSFGVTITAREDLATLWLPWCVVRRHPDVALRIDHEPHRRHEARQLRVADLDDQRVRCALSTYARPDGTDVLSSILILAANYAAATERVVIQCGEAFNTPEGMMLHEASHRSCAIYESGIDDFELWLAVRDIQPSWRVYADPALRH